MRTHVFCGALTLLCLFGSFESAFAVGCISGGVVPNNSVGEQFKLNRPGRVRLSYNYAFSDTDHFYFHEKRQHNVERGTLATSLVNEHLAVLEVDITERVSGVLEVPFIYSRQTRSGPASAAVNGAMIGAGLADIRIGARLWFLQSDEASLRLYALGGLRLPTGGSKEKFTSQAGNRVHKDVSVQPGTGNVAPYLELGGTVSLEEQAYMGLFFQTRYVFTPATNTRARNFRNELSGNGYQYNSDSDAMTWRVGASFSLGRAIREAVSDEEIQAADGVGILVALTGSYVPYDDLIGGDSGFRRGANMIFIEPGIVWAISERITLNASAPLTVYRHVNKNGGNVPEFIVQGGITITLN